MTLSGIKKKEKEQKSRGRKINQWYCRINIDRDVILKRKVNFFFKQPPIFVKRGDAIGRQEYRLAARARASDVLFTLLSGEDWKRDEGPVCGLGEHTITRLGGYKEG